MTAEELVQWAVTIASGIGALLMARQLSNTLLTAVKFGLCVFMAIVAVLGAIEVFSLAIHNDSRFVNALFSFASLPVPPPPPPPPPPLSLISWLSRLVDR